MDNNNRLDVEDDEDRQNRIQALLEKLNTSSKPHTHHPEFQKFEFGDRSTFPAPPSELLSRVQAFLPQLQASNDALSQRVQEDPDSINIEHVTEDIDQYIEMNLGLGVFEDRRNKNTSEEDQDKDQDAEMSTSSSSTSTSSSMSSTSAEEGEGDSDVDSDMSSEIITSFIPVRPIKPLPRRLRSTTSPRITVLEETLHEN